MAEWAKDTMLWGAGTAKVEPNAPKAVALGLLRTRGLGVLKYAVNLALLVVVGTQVVSMGFQALRESTARPEIKSMQVEQKWLVGQGLAPERRIGRLPPKGAGHSIEAHRDVGAFSAPTLAIAGWDLSMGGALLARAAKSMGLSASWLEGGWAISAALPSESGAKGAWGHGAAATYRHEEAHAGMAERKIKAGAPTAWPAEVGRAVALDIDARWALSWHMDDAQQAGWRSEWLSGIHREAFADAFEVLSSARKGQGAMAKAALNTHAMRVFQAKGSKSASASLMAGSDHAVDMASFLAGQFDEAAVARLKGPELDVLARAVADRSVAWALARQAPALGFFEGSGRAWWEAVASTRSVPVAERESLWRAWSAGALGETPAAVFGGFEVKAGGGVFKAAGLPQWAARIRIESLNKLEAKTNALWRFDGMGGQVIMSDAWDPQAKMLSGHRLVFELPGKLIAGDPEKLRDDPDAQRHAKAALVGAVATHAALCENLIAMGCVPEVEARRVDEGVSEESFGIAALDLAKSRASKAPSLKKAPKARV